jgi:hypothetical protein
VLPTKEAYVMFSCHEFCMAKWKPTGRYQRVHEGRIMAMAFGQFSKKRKRNP